ncbi:cytochrome [Zhihengliuella sp.]|uniref:cytochrome n=1 Tax=Zhihengliuella sp. TaxID=1954483 RepID=UPI0028115E2B|nr:cytochrome [Zhihengliuella sp.]
MTTPALAQQTDLGRMYARTVGGPLEVPSITTVIGQASTDLTGWAGHMAASAAVRDPRLASAVGSPGQLTAIARDASRAAATHRDGAAARGDRVHQYCEQLALRQLGREHRLDAARADLETHGEGSFAQRVDEWWSLYGVEPIAAEITVWNHTVGYAGTLDLVARIGGRLCLIDYKTKGTTRDGRAKPLDNKVVMQLVAGYKAEEMIADPVGGAWEPWPHGGDGVPLLLGVAVSETEVVAQQAQPATLPTYWRKFWALRQAWEADRVLAGVGPALRPIAPPPVTAAPDSSGAAT